MIKNKNYKIGDRKIKIALLSDFHFDTYYNIDLLDNILQNLKINKPDYICISGDIIDDTSVINKEEVMTLIKKFIKELSTISSTIISLGNHDIKNKKIDFEIVNKWFLSLNTIENVYYLNNKSLIRGDICFTSYNPPYEYYESKENYKLILNDIDEKIHITKNYYNILLCHSPISILKKEFLNKSKTIKNTNLILSGHMHNGLVFNIFDKKGNRGLISPDWTLLPKYSRGLVKINEKLTAVISGGIVKFPNNQFILNKFNKLYPSHIEYIMI